MCRLATSLLRVTCLENRGWGNRRYITGGRYILYKKGTPFAGKVRRTRRGRRPVQSSPRATLSPSATHPQAETLLISPSSSVRPHTLENVSPVFTRCLLRPRKTLQKKLGTWSANVQALLATIQKSNER